MAFIRRVLALFFLSLIVLAFQQCARRGNPTGGPKDVTPPVLLRAEPENLSTNFDAKKIRLYFDEYIQLNDVQNQLIISPPLKYVPLISPQGGASKYVEVILKDTLQENTTYTLNFGQSIVDNNERNPNPFLTYVFSTGDYIDSLSISGVVKDALNKEADQFISVMLYAIDTAYTDSTIYKQPPNYMTNTLDSTIIFNLRYLKEGKYALVAIKDEGKNNIFDQGVDKIGFLKDTLTLPTDSIFLLTLFKEIPDYSVPPPTYAAANKIIFGYNGQDEELKIEPLSVLPDTIKTLVAKDPEKDTLNFWFTPFEVDSLVFKVSNENRELIDTFTVKTRKLAADSLMLSLSHSRAINFEDDIYLSSNIPLSSIDTSKVSMIDQDTTQLVLDMKLDTAMNRIALDFEKTANTTYAINLLPGAVTDFFESTNDTITYRLSTGSYADYGNLRLNITGAVSYPMLVQLTGERGDVLREQISAEPGILEFNTLDPGNYLIRAIFDQNANGRWDTGNYLKKIQPERVVYYPQTLEVRANWELEQTFTIPE
ncbi:MAG: Ig-like domain-containing protein [Bacteroidota bacterium]